MAPIFVQIRARNAHLEFRSEISKTLAPEFGPSRAIFDRPPVELPSAEPRGGVSIGCSPAPPSRRYFIAMTRALCLRRTWTLAGGRRRLERPTGVARVATWRRPQASGDPAARREVTGDEARGLAAWSTHVRIHVHACARAAHLQPHPLAHHSIPHPHRLTPPRIHTDTNTWRFA